MASAAPTSRVIAWVSDPKYTRLGSAASGIPCAIEIHAITTVEANAPTTAPTRIPRVRPTFHNSQASTGHTK